MESAGRARRRRPSASRSTPSPSAPSPLRVRAVGRFDEQLMRNQDNDLNARIRLAGGSDPSRPAIAWSTSRAAPTAACSDSTTSTDYGKGGCPRSTDGCSTCGASFRWRSSSPSQALALRRAGERRLDAGSWRSRGSATDSPASCSRSPASPAAERSCRIGSQAAAAFPVFHVAHGLGMLRAPARPGLA